MASHLHQLQRRKALIEARLAQIVQDHSQPRSRHSEDRAQECENDEVLNSLGTCSLDELLSVRKAIQRCENGSYGLCVNCGETIAEQRLNALPDTEFCARCAVLNP